ncbi:GRIP and coiled-coil domain-containing protein 2 [Calliphora vicina]|uniref:GRIP and coiled-coil domain-containing protein 2 n=1 Tax=Calliphora vicina TaxID=7373 RepID=UPI00325AD17D
MEEEKMDTSQQGQKMSLESLSKEEIIQKYKGLLGIAKKAKQAKDEISEENRKLKEQLQQHETQKDADKKALLTMKEMLEVYTENKLQLTTQVAELQKQRKLDTDNLEKFAIENESLKRQLQRLTDDNESLLTDIENMEAQLKQVSGFGKEQKENLVLLEKEIVQLKEAEAKSHEIQLKNEELSQELQEMKEKYKFIKDINTEQRHKFNSLKDRFIEVHKKLKKLKECKRILLETQHEYADSVSQWQNEIIRASKVLCKELNNLRDENIKLLQKLGRDRSNENVGEKIVCVDKLNELLQLSEKAKHDYHNLQEENVKLKENLGIKPNESSSVTLESSVKRLDEMWQLSKTALQEYHAIRAENVMLKENAKSKVDHDQLDSSKEFEKCYKIAVKLQELQALAQKASEDYQIQSLELEKLKEDYEQLKNKNEIPEISEDRNEKLLKTEKSLLDAQTEQQLQQEKHGFENQTQELENMKAELFKINEENHHLKTQLQDVSKASIQKSLEDSLKKSQSECQELSEKLKSLEQEQLKDKQYFESLSLDLHKVNEEKLALNNKIQELQKTAGETEAMFCLKEQLLAAQQSLEEYQQMYKNKEMEHGELLDEMRELNEALKARGDLISRQHEEHQILKTDLKTNAEKLADIQQEIDKKDLQLTEKQSELETITKEISMTKQKVETLEHTSSLNEEKVRVLSIELENIKSNTAATSNELDNQSDVLSTSTISRADELQRLKDVEDSFEDKYNKLRGLAAKLKKKLQEETIVKHRLEKEIQDFKSHENELNAQLVELKNKISDMDSLQKQVNEKQKHIDSLKAENQKLKLSRKQANVLNLEIEAAEKSLTDVTNKLATRSLELEAAQESLKSKDSTILQLRKEIDLLESSKASEIKHSQELKQQIDHLHKTLRDEMHSKQQAYDKSKILEQDLENLKLELENVNSELAQSTSNQESALRSLNNEREQLSLQLSTTQEALSDCEQKLKQADRVTEDLRVEYLDYKVKAQAVLRKNQNRDSSKERELEEELVTMRATETRLNATIQTLTTKIETLEKQKDSLNDDNIRIQKRSKELMTLIEDIRTQNDALNQEIQQNVQQQHETLKQHRQHIESMDNCHKDQIQSLNTSHQRQLEQLRIELSQHIRLPTTVGAIKSTNQPPHAHIDYHSIDQGKLDFLLMEREDAEGSEEAAETLANLAASRKISNDSSSAKRSLHDFMPLDELLNTPLNAINSETLITNSQHQQHHYVTDNAMSVENTTTDFLQLELNSTKERLQKQESRVRHLTALLAENEQDLAKLTQMNDMLKEELRRQERSVEREQHMHNSEYVKNVIMKFLTLNNADEKTRLVPVLNTILKLNRSEAEMLNCVAKGQKVTETTPRTGGWGNFLPWGNNSNNN